MVRSSSSSGKTGEEIVFEILFLSRVALLALPYKRDFQINNYFLSFLTISIHTDSVFIASVYPRK